MTERYPPMDIYFPPLLESKLHAEMKHRAISPWSSQENDAFNRSPKDGAYYFHRDIVDNQPSCTLCIRREKEGYWTIRVIVPDEGQIRPIPLNIWVPLFIRLSNRIKVWTFFIWFVGYHAVNET